MKLKKITQNRKNASSFFAKLLAIIIMIYFVNPKFSFANQLIFISLCFLWLLLAFTYKKNVLLDIVKSRIFIFSCIFPLISIIFWLTNYSLINKHILLLPFILIISAFYINTENKSFLNSVIIIILSYLFLITIVTLIKLQTVPDLARLLAQGNKNAISNIITPFTATYATTYSISLLGVCSFYIGLYSKKSFKKIFLFLSCIYILLFLFKTAYTISLLIYILGIFLSLMVFVWNKIENKKKTLKIFLVSFIFLFIAYFFTRNIIADQILLLQKFAPDIMQQRRIQEIARLVRNFGFETEGGMINRINIYLISLNTFLANPFIGIGFKEKYLYTTINVINPKIGNHSTILDMLASYGILGIFYILLIPFYYKALFKEKISNTAMLKIILALFITLSLINTTENITFYYIMIFLIPALAFVSKEKIEEEKTWNMH